MCSFFKELESSDIIDATFVVRTQIGLTTTRSYGNLLMVTVLNVSSLSDLRWSSVFNACATFAFKRMSSTDAYVLGVMANHSAMKANCHIGF